MKQLIIGAVVVMVLTGGLVLAALLYIGVISPETYIYSGKQVPNRFLNEVRELGLIQENEEVKYFYSDGLLDIKEGFYLVTDKELVLFSKNWEKHSYRITWDEIQSIQVEYDDSFFFDTYVSLVLKNSNDVFFPLSSEQGRDKRFIAYLENRTGVKASAFK